MMLFLTACNQTPPNETTTGSSQNQEKPEDGLPQGIVKNGVSDLIDITSRILFEQNGKVFYYSKADGKAYVYCFDPLCDHAGGKCLANPKNFENIHGFELRCTFFINNRFYVATQYGQIYSFAFDGSDLKIEYGKESYSREEFLSAQTLWSPNFCVYDKYIYIPLRADENGNSHTLRFNTETKEMEDLTEKTGNDILIYFFYNEEIYGLDIKLRTWVKADLDLKEMEPIEAQPTTSQFYGSVFFDCAYEQIDSKTKKYIGLQSYDMKTGETKIITNEMLGLEEANQCVVAAVDENYVYFYPYKQILVGTYINAKGQEKKLYKYNEGKLYRVKHDGTECTLIYDNPNFEFNSREAVICDNKIIIEGRSIGMRDGYADTWDRAMKIGTIGEDGKIDKFENIELVY